MFGICKLLFCDETITPTMLLEKRFVITPFFTGTKKIIINSVIASRTYAIQIFKKMFVFTLRL